MASKREKIAALLRKANCTGATKDEAIAAMEMAAKLAAAEGLSLHDIETESAETSEDAYERRDWTSGKDHLHPVDLLLARSIGAFCACKVWRDVKKGAHYVCFYGHEADMELASYLREVFRNALENEWTKYKFRKLMEGGNFNVRAARQSFVREFCDEIKGKLEKWTNRKPETGTSLVVLKNELMLRRWAKYAEDNGIHLGQVGGRTYVSHDGAAAAAGREAGARVNFNDRAAGGGQKVKLIGR